ncbi:hypothetical protein M0L20_18210 [Spirosoma sp. RP8]|uniref:Uncharacterized protein n=1 Tax=Spirosoma liriopis TaxID=2937440 RepID=A0ABT0HNQ7_9BACT|nr:hypothetical protein [Spirosoma liriopis]MCK8493806.1 hypothetical protein [Spirosoma liriopis]
MKNAILITFLTVFTYLNVFGQTSSNRASSAMPTSTTTSSTSATSSTTVSATTASASTTSTTSNARADTLIKDDFLLFAGSNIDPNNDGSPVTSTSFEGIFKFTISKLVHMRVGAYSHRNFTKDSAVFQRTAYINTIPGSPLAIDTTQLAVQRYGLNREITTRSYGFYADVFRTLTNPEDKDLRISVFLRYEYVYRQRVSPITSIESAIIDTIPYSQQLASQRIVVINSPISRDNYFSFPSHIYQQYISVGFAIEKATKAFDLFFQPTFGFVVTKQRIQRGDETIFPPTIRQAILGLKAQATVKVLDVTLTADIKGITSASPFTNITVGIPISYSKITERIKKAYD